MEPTSEPLILLQKKRRREDDIMDEHKKAGVYPPFYSSDLFPLSPSSNCSPSSSLSLLRITQQFETLPLDVLLHILSFLPHKQLLRLTYTSKKCKETIYNSALWNTIKLDDSTIMGEGNKISNKEDLLPFEYFKRLNRKLLSFVREIYMDESTCRNFGEGRHFARSLLWICKNCTALQKLQLDWCASLLNNDIVSLTQENIQLLHLSMTFNPILVSDIGITLLARLGLERLDLSLFKNITERGIREFIAKCKNIRRVTVDTCGCIDDESLDNLKKLFPNVRIAVPSDTDDEDFIPPQMPDIGPFGMFGSDDDDMQSDSQSSGDDSDNFFYNDSDEEEDGDSDSSGGRAYGGRSAAAPRAASNGKQPTVAQQNGHKDSEDDDENDEDFHASAEEGSSSEGGDEEEGEGEDEDEDTQRDEAAQSGEDDEDTEKEEEQQQQ